MSYQVHPLPPSSRQAVHDNPGIPGTVIDVAVTAGPRVATGRAALPCATRPRLSNRVGTELVVQEHVPEQLDVVAVLGRLAVGVTAARSWRSAPNRSPVTT